MMYVNPNRPRIGYKKGQVYKVESELGLTPIDFVLSLIVCPALVSYWRINSKALPPDGLMFPYARRSAVAGNRAGPVSA